jgi:hypothetical protein
MTVVYICLLFDAEDAIVNSTTIVTARNGADAQAKAYVLLRETPFATGFELWLDGSKLYSHSPDRNQSSAR